MNSHTPYCLGMKKQRIIATIERLVTTQKLNWIRHENRYIIHVRVVGRLKNWQHKTRVHLVDINIAGIAAILVCNHRRWLRIIVSQLNHLCILIVLPVWQHRHVGGFMSMCNKAFLLRTCQTDELLHKRHEVLGVCVDDLWEMCADYNRVMALILLWPTGDERRGWQQWGFRQWFINETRVLVPFQLRWAQAILYLGKELHRAHC